MADQVFGQSVDQRIETMDDLRAVIPPAQGLTIDKVRDHVDAVSARFIAASPLVFLATRRASGRVDVTPRGDPAGFVRVLDPQTLALPDRQGNRRLDAIEAILETGAVGLSFCIPGQDHLLRVTGTAAVVRDAALAGSMAVKGRAPDLIVLIRVAEVMGHCPKAFIRGDIWHPERWPDAGSVPSLAEMLKVHAGMEEPREAVDKMIAESVAQQLY